MYSTIVTEYKVSLSVGVDAADAALKTKCMLQGSENENGANRQHRGREGRNTRAGVHNERKASYSATTLSTTGSQLQRRTANSEVYVTQLLATFRDVAAANAR